MAKIENAFIIHGAFGNPQENWFPWLKKELENRGIKTYIPAFPTPKNQTLENWQNKFKEYAPFLNEKSIIIGHSVGPAFILNVLERIDFSIKAAFLVAPFIGALGNLEVDGINKTFVEKEFNWAKIKRNCKKFYIYSSDNDPYVPLEKGKFLAEKLEAKFEVLHNAGHMNKAAGYLQFPQLLKDISEKIQE